MPRTIKRRLVALTLLVFLAVPVLRALSPFAAFLLGVWVGGILPWLYLVHRHRRAHSGITVLDPAERRVEELHEARIDTERAKAEALRARKRPRELQDKEVKRAYIEGATDQAHRDS